MIRFYYKKNYSDFWNFSSDIWGFCEQPNVDVWEYQNGVWVFYGVLSEIWRTAWKMFQFNGLKILFLQKTNRRFAQLTIMAPILKDRGNREHFQLVG